MHRNGKTILKDVLMKIKLGISPINWCNDDDTSLGGDISFKQCIEEMALAGYKGTEIGHKYPQNANDLNAALASNGLEIYSAWFSTYFTEPDKYQKTLSDFLDRMSFLRSLGARYINVCECGHSIQQTSHPVLGSHKPVFNEAEWHALIQGLHQIGRIAYDFNMHIVYHYHAGTGVFTEAEIDYLMQHTSPLLISLLLDTGHAAFADIDPVNLIKKYGNRIRYVHLKDIRQPILLATKQNAWNFMDAVRAGVFTVPGDGFIDFKAVFNTLKAHDYAGLYLVEAEQDPAKAIPLHYAKKAYAHINQLINE